MFSFFSFFSPPPVFLTTIPTIFSEIYHESRGIGGLHYIALGLGLSISSQINARMMDRVYIHFKKRNGNVGEPEFRLRMSSSAFCIDVLFTPSIFSVNGAWIYCFPDWPAPRWVGCYGARALDCHRSRKSDFSCFKKADRLIICKGDGIRWRWIDTVIPSYPNLRC